MASAPIEAVRYLLEVLRCSSCQTTISASPPKDLTSEKTQPSAKAAVTILKYGMGLPFKRLETWQKYCGTPLPDATQYDMCASVASCCWPIFRQLESLAANGSLFYLDDTGMPVLSLLKENKDRDEKAR